MLGGSLLRIAAVSDIHARSDGLDDDLIEAIRHRIDEINPDIVIVAGDVSETIGELEYHLGRLVIDSATNLYVAGNHDVWFEEDTGLGSLEKYSRTIGDVCRRTGFIHLPDEPQIHNGIGFIGSMGWYDYSFRRPDLEIPEENYIQKQWKGSIWRDYYSIDWPYTDKEITELLNSKLQYDLKTMPDSVSKIIYISHHLPFRELTFYKDCLPWDFFSAFMGSMSTGDILKDDGRVMLSISGHSHIRRKLQVGDITAITVPLGYGRPLDGEFASLAFDAVAVIEIEDGSLTLGHFFEGDISEGMPYVF